MALNPIVSGMLRRTRGPAPSFLDFQDVDPATATTEADFAAEATPPPAVPAYRQGGVIVHRGTAAPQVFLPRQPRVGVPGPAAGGDDYGAMLAEAQRPFRVGSGTYDLGELDAAANQYADNQRLRTAPILAQRDQRDIERGKLANDAEQNAIERQKADYAMSPEYQQSRLAEIAAGQGNLAATNPVAAAERGQYVPPQSFLEAKYPQVFPAGKEAPTMDEALRRHTAAGLPPVAPESPEDAAWRGLYGTEIGTRERGEPAAFHEREFATGSNVGDLLQLGIPSITRYFSGAPSPRRASEAAVRRIFPRVGVRGVAPKVGVGMDAVLARRAARRAAYNPQSGSR